MASETGVQQFVHKLEEGGWAVWVLRAVMLAAILFTTAVWFFDVTIPFVGKGPNGFKGLWHEKAIEQAQIARELARGNGFSTKMIRPAALWQFKDNMGVFNLEQTPDTYHAPLGPWVSSIALRFGNFVRGLFVDEEDPWLMTRKDISYPHDKVLAATQLIFFLLSVLVAYFTAKRLFDRRLANLGAGLLLLCERFWDFSMSGLPQMLLLFLFVYTMHVLVLAIEARNAAKPAWPWMLGVGVGFGLLALTHALTIWIFMGALIFCVIFFTPRWLALICLLGTFFLCYAPWLIRNHQVCGNSLGLGWYSGLAEIRGSESEVMRTMALEGPLEGVSPWQYREKLQYHTLIQFSGIYGFLGSILVAPLFFVSLLHFFKSREAAQLRWAILLMWLFGVLGMSAFGLEAPHYWPAPQLKSNDLHILFIPLMTFYGLGFVLVLWSRLEIGFRWARVAFISIIFVISAMPFIAQFIDLNSQSKGRIMWPPYVPPFIAILNEFTTEREVIASDMPWGVAWYADRKSLLLPMTLKDFTSLSDYNTLGGPLVGLYLTPVTGDKAFIRDIMKGEYREWAPFITRQVTPASLRNFPLKAMTALPWENECVFYADRDRWTTRED